MVTNIKNGLAWPFYIHMENSICFVVLCLFYWKLPLVIWRLLSENDIIFENISIETYQYYSH